MTDCIFCKIIKNEVSSKKEYEDQDFIIFHDIKPSAPIHLLIVPKVHFEWQGNLEGRQELLGKIFIIAPQIAEKVGIKNSGFKLVMNCGKGAGQIVPHLHFHLIGGWNRNV